MESVFESIDLSGIANFIEHEGIMLRDDLVNYQVLHHSSNRDNARKRIKVLRDALTSAEQRIEDAETYRQSLKMKK